jgi:hypothetical protein
MRTKDEGHGLISASEDGLLKKADTASPTQMMNLLNSIVGAEEPKKLKGAK